MKKITLIASALLTVSALMAAPVRMAENLSSLQVQTVENAGVRYIDAALPLHRTGVAKAPAATNAIKLEVGAQDGYGTAPFAWTSDGTSGVFEFLIFAGNEPVESKYVCGIAFAATGLASLLQDGVYYFTIADLVYNATKKQASALPAGEYYLQITGYDAAYQQVVEAAAGAAFEIISYDVTGFAFTVNDAHTQATISWDYLPLPDNHLYLLSVTCGGETVYNSAATGQTATSPVIIDVQEGNTYSVLLIPVEVYNQKLYPACDKYISELITVGVNSREPKNLSALVDGNRVSLKWEADTPVDFYWVYIYDSEGNEVVSDYTENALALDTVLTAGSYIWAVSAMTPQETSLYPISETIWGNDFVVEGTTALHYATTLDGVTYANGIVRNEGNIALRVYNAAGMLVAESTSDINMNNFANGVYMICTKQGALKIVK